MARAALAVYPEPMIPVPSSPSSDDARWQAVLARDAAQDGLFYYGVHTTGIFCRPACPSRRPRRENIQFFEDLESAQAAGFRPCLRCTPTQISARQRAVAHVKRLLDESETAPALTELARVVQLSPAYLQRLFKAQVGVSPKQYALARRAERLKARLRSGSDVTTALFEAGHSSASTLYSAQTDQLGMAPGVYQKGGAGQRIAYTVVESKLGQMLVAATRRGLVAVRFGEEAELVAELRAEYPHAELSDDAPALQAHISAIQAYLAGQERRLNLPRDVSSTDFQRRVWEALQAIPYGQTRSYAQVAEMIGSPSAVRAVARACASNPVALIVPCHRVVRSGGALSGYRWGVERKRALLDAERSAL